MKKSKISLQSPTPIILVNERLIIMSNLESKLDNFFPDTTALMNQNDKPLFPSVKSFAKKVVSTGLMLSMLYSGAAQLNASTESSLESSTGSYEKVDANNGVKKKHKSALPWIIAGGVVVGAAIYFLTQKKADPLPPQPVPINIDFSVYNHTKGKIGVYKVNTIVGTRLEVKISALLDYLRNNGGDMAKADVDASRIAVRMPAQDGKIGSFVAYAGTGAVSFTAASNMASLDAFVMNASNKAPYDRMDSPNFSNLLDNTRNYVVYRKDFDGQTGPEAIWKNVFNQLNSALDLGWIKYGSINRQPSATSGDFSYGYGYSHGGAGWHQGNLILIDTQQCSDELVMTMVGLSEGFENICGVDDIDGNSSLGIIQTDGLFNSVGKDLFRYTFVKDKAPK